MGKMTAAEKALQRQAQDLADDLGCLIEYELDTDTLWVWGPETVYGGGDNEEDDRHDPCRGEHCHHGWDEVLDALHVYRRDLYWEAAGVSPADLERLRDLAPPLVAACEDNPYEPYRRGILADWLEENGRDGLSAILRAEETPK